MQALSPPQTLARHVELASHKQPTQTVLTWLNKINTITKNGQRLWDQSMNSDCPFNTIPTLAESAIQIIKKPETPSALRCNIAIQLEKLGVIVTGNLNPTTKPFNPDKCQLVPPMNGAHQQRILHTKRIHETKDDQTYPFFNKRNKLTAQLIFLATISTHEEKTYQLIPVPIYNSQIQISKKARHQPHSEDALIETLESKECMQLIINTINRAIPPSPSKAIKLTGCITQLSSTYKSCDRCHSKLRQLFLEPSSKWLITLKTAIKKNNMQLSKPTPSTQTEPFRTTVLVEYTLAPISSASKNTYDIPSHHISRSNRMPSSSLFSDKSLIQTIHQRHVKKGPPMTLFLSGQGDEETWGYNIALIQNLVARSVDQTSVESALKEWEFNGQQNENEDLEPCDICETPIRHSFEISNTVLPKINGEANCLSIGCECIKKFTSIGIHGKKEPMTEKERDHYFKTITSGKSATIQSLLAPLGPDINAHFKIHQSLRLNDIMALELHYKDLNIKPPKKIPCTITTKELATLNKSTTPSLHRWLPREVKNRLTQLDFFSEIRSNKPQQLKQKIDQITHRFIENSTLSQTDFKELLNFKHDLTPQFNISGIEEMTIIPSKLKAMKALLSTPMIEKLNRRHGQLENELNTLLEAFDRSNRSSQYGQTFFYQSFQFKETFTLRNIHRLVQYIKHQLPDHKKNNALTAISLMNMSNEPNKLTVYQRFQIKPHVPPTIQQTIHQSISMITVPYLPHGLYQEFKKCIESNIPKDEQYHSHKEKKWVVTKKHEQKAKQLMDSYLKKLNEQKTTGSKRTFSQR